MPVKEARLVFLDGEFDDRDGAVWFTLKDVILRAASPLDWCGVFDFGNVALPDKFPLEQVCVFDMCDGTRRRGVVSVSLWKEENRVGARPFRGIGILESVDVCKDKKTVRQIEVTPGLWVDRAGIDVRSNGAVYGLARLDAEKEGGVAGIEGRPSYWPETRSSSAKEFKPKPPEQPEARSLFWRASWWFLETAAVILAGALLTIYIRG